MHYKNSHIISRYNKDYPHAAMQAEDALSELMKFIWLCLKHKAEKQLNPSDESLYFSCVIHPEMDDLDKMWHTFLLYTKDYHAFCRDYLGGIFFHHEPLDNSDDDELDEQELTLYLSYIYDNLGENTLITWFSKRMV